MAAFDDRAAVGPYMHTSEYRPICFGADLKVSSIGKLLTIAFGYNMIIGPQNGHVGRCDNPKVNMRNCVFVVLVLGGSRGLAGGDDDRNFRVYLDGKWVSGSVDLTTLWRVHVVVSEDIAIILLLLL